MKQNPFTGAMIFAWAVFSAMAVIGEFKPKAMWIWAPWLSFLTVAAFVWWWKHRRTS